MKHILPLFIGVLILGTACTATPTPPPPTATIPVSTSTPFPPTSVPTLTPMPTLTPLPSPTKAYGVSRSSIDVTDHVEVLGNPYQAKYPEGEWIYARNIWDMVAFNGELLIGAGNSSNSPPASNAGPVPIFSYSPSTARFREVFTVDDEQIDIFRILGGQVYIPGHDPREEWETGNFYRMESDGTWRKYRNVPSAIHLYDMALVGQMLFACGNLHGAAVAVSKDMGLTWSISKTPIYSLDTRIYSFLIDEEELYAVGEMNPYQSPEVSPGVYQHNGDGTFHPRTDLEPKKMFPGITFPAGVLCTKIVRSVTFKNHAIYVGSYCSNDHQSHPFGLFVVESLRVDDVSIHQVVIPHNSRIWDLLIEDETIYVLMDTPDAEGTIIRVASSQDGIEWTEILNFRARTFARSFALLNGDFYFGLGSEIRPRVKWDQLLLPETGQIIRVRREFWQKTTLIEGDP